MNIVKVPVGKDLPAFECDVDLLPQDMIYKLAFNPGVGLKNKLLDARAGCYPTKKDDAGNTVPNPDYSVANATAYVQKVWDNLCQGVWGRERGAAANLSPVEARVLKIATATVTAYAKSQGVKVPSRDLENFDELVEEYTNDNKEELTAQAERELAAEALRPAGGVNLAGLGLKIKPKA